MKPESRTLALAALGLVRVPTRPIAFFGLIHGLAFATTLGELGLGRSERVASILGFNLGIEAMQLIVVAVTMPSLVLLSRTSSYSVLRIGGALFAGFASLGWIAERLLGVHNSVDGVVHGAAHHGLWIAVGFFVISLTCSLLPRLLHTQATATEPLPRRTPTVRQGVAGFTHVDRTFGPR